MAIRKDGTCRGVSMQRVEAGKVTDRISLLGAPESCFYLVDGGTEQVVVGGGMAYLAPQVEDQLRDLSVEEKKIRRLLILHAHFDHCGLIPFLKRRWPWVIVAASERARELLSNSDVSEYIRELNRASLSRAGLDEHAEEYGFTGVHVEEILREGDRVPCGDLTLEVIEVPGHSSCSIAVYLKEEKALFASDAAGVRYGDFYMVAGNSNFDAYQQSLEKMSRLDVEVVLGEHYGALGGEEGRSYLRRAIQEARTMREVLEESYRRTGDVEKSTAEIADLFVSEAPEGFLSPDVLRLVAGQMVRYVARKAGKSVTSDQ